MTSPDPSKKSKVQTIGSAVVTIGSEAIAAALGAVAEQHQPGSGVAVKAGFSTFLRSSYSNISKIFSDREKHRVEVAVNSAEIKFQELENDGFERRNDEFFEEDSISGNSHAIEFFEGGLRAAMSAFQEQKVRFIGNLMGSMPFRKDIPIETAILCSTLREM